MAPSNSSPTAITSATFSFRWEVKNDPGTSLSRAAQEASSASPHESENRGVTAYRSRRFPCQRSASAFASS